MQNDKWDGVNPYAGETPLEKAARHKARRAEAKALGITKSGNTKRKTRAARNANDRLRREEAEAAVKKLTEVVKGSVAENPASNRASSDRPPKTAAPRGLTWPAAAASAPAPPPVPVAAPRAPSPARDPLDDYEEPTRAATPSPEPEDRWSDQDWPPLASDGSAGASPVGSPSP
jgi:hypothetical protein